MKIIPRFQYGGNTGIGRTTSDWYKYVHSKQSQHILDMLSKYGEKNDYGYWLNDMQHSHSQIYNAAGGANEAWKKKAYSNESVKKYQNDYLGNSNNQGTQINEEDYFNYNNLGIANAYNNNVFTAPGKRLSGDNPSQKYVADGLYSSVTDWRRLLGRKGDWDENSQEFRNWKQELNKRGWDTYLDDSDGYYKLKRLPLQESPNNPPSETPQKPNPQPQQTGESTEIGSGPTGDKKETPQGNDLLGRLRGMIPGLLSTGRLAGNLINNARVYDEALKGIRPTLIQPYYTHRQVVGDEATKQAYYRRAAAGQTKAAQPFTSDADRQMAYMQEARRIGDELRAQGDLADNQEIRRTSDESNQHEWANTQRATEVANTNLASLNDANEKKHTLLAQKNSAQWSSIDNYLKEIETRKRQQMEEDNAYNKQIDLLEYENQIANDPDLKKATEKLYALRDANGNWDTTSEAYKTAKQEYDQVQARIKLQTLQKYRDINRKYKSPFFIKSGSKITYKKDDKLLYKSTKDVVDHFRRMCKRYPEKERKIQPLAPHPDGTRRRKYQVGGQFLAPFTIYTPAVGVDETARTVSQDSIGASSKAASSSKDTSSKDVLDLIKMFKDLKGVKVDVSSIYSTLSGVLQEAEIFGKELNSQQIASMYLRAMQQLNNVSRSKEIYDEAYKVAAANGALNEIAVDSVGNYAVQNKETGKIETVSKIDTSKHIPLTNSQLLTLREYRPDLAFDKGDYIMQNVVANGVGLLKIAEQVKSMAGKLGNSELKLDGISEVEANQIRQGIKLLQGAPDGYYKTTTETKNQLAQKQAAINYIMQMLPENYKAVLDIHGGAKNLIPTFLSSQIDDSQTVSFSPLTGKAASDKNNSSNRSSKGDSDNSAGLSFVLGQGPRVPVVFNTGTSYQVTANGIQGVLQTKSNENLGQGATLQDATKSQEGGYFQWNKATFGGSKLIPTAYSHIILNDSSVIGVDLPYKKGIDGNEVPDFQQLRRMEEADQEIRQKGIQSDDYKTINQIYQNHQLPPKYDQNGKLIKKDYKRFAVIQATLDETSLQDKNAILSDEVAIASEVERDLYNESMRKITGNQKFELDDGWPIFGGGTKLYKGSIFVPYQEDIAFAALSSGKPFNTNLPNNSSTVQQMQYAPATLTYKPQDVTLSQITNN